MQLDQLAKQGMELWKKLSFARRVALAVVVALALAGGLFAALYEPDIKYANLVSDLSEADASAVVEELVAAKVVHRVKTVDGQVTIQVAAEDVDRVRLSIASKDLPGSKAGLETFGDGAYGVPEAVGQVKYNWALSQELARTIKSLDAVRDARVHLATPKKSIYKKMEVAPSASITVHLKPGHNLSAAEVRGVVNLVARSVEGLTPASVTMVDKSGKELWAGGDDGHASMLQRDLERERRSKIEALLERVLGPNQYEVVVTAQIDRTKVRRTEELYDNDKRALVSEEVREDRRGLGVVRSGVVGARSNVTGAAVVAEPPAATTGLVATGTNSPGSYHASRNFGVSKVITDTEQPEIRVERMHVAVLVNAPEPVVKTSSVATASLGVALNDGVLLGTPREPPDLGKLASMIKAAGGLDLERGDTLELATMPFYVDPESLPKPEPPPVPVLPAWYLTLPLWAYGVAAGSVVLLMLAFLLAVKRARRRAAEEEADLVAYPARADELEAVLEGADYEPAPTLAELRAKVHELMLTNGDLAAEILAAWINDQAAEGAEGSA